MRKLYAIGAVVVALSLCGCPTPYIAAQRSILNAVDVLKAADTLVVEVYPTIEGTDEERVAWLTKAVCALTVTRDILQIGWDITWYWSEGDKVCRDQNGDIVGESEDGSNCEAPERSWQDWVRLSAPVALHAILVLKDFGINIPDGVNDALTNIGAVLIPDFDPEEFNRQFDACVDSFSD